MIERLFKHSQSILFVVLIATLGTLFATQFGPRGGGCTNRSAWKINYIARVYNYTVSEQDFQAVARRVNLSGSRNPDLLRSAIVDGLIEREVMIHEAERLGFRISDDEINREIRDGYFYVSLGTKQLQQLAGAFGGVPISARQLTVYTPAAEGETEPRRPKFNYEDFENWVKYFYGRTVNEYKQFLAREMLAERMRNLATASVRASEDEVWRDYERGHSQIALRYVRFSPRFFEQAVRDDDNAAIDQYLAAHTDAVNEEFGRRREQFRALPDQIRIRQILLRYPPDAQEPTRTATRLRAEALRAKIVAGQDFVRVARLYSQDEITWRAGGDSGWVTTEQLDLPSDVKTAVMALQPGQLSAVLPGASGVFIVQVVGRRQGDLAEDAAKREIARELYVRDRSRELAQQAAERALQATTTAGGTGVALEAAGLAAHNEGLEAFYRGPVPATETLPGNDTLTVESHGDIDAPELRETQSFTRGASIPGISDSEAVARAGFALTAEHSLHDQVLTAGEDRLIVRLKEGSRQVASREDFNRERQRLMDEYVLPRRREALVQFVTQLREAAQLAGEIHNGESSLLRSEPSRPTRNNDNH